MHRVALGSQDSPEFKGIKTIERIGLPRVEALKTALNSKGLRRVLDLNVVRRHPSQDSPELKGIKAASDPLDSLAIHFSSRMNARFFRPGGGGRPINQSRIFDRALAV